MAGVRVILNHLDGVDAIILGVIVSLQSKPENVLSANKYLIFAAKGLQATIDFYLKNIKSFFVAFVFCFVTE